MGMDMFLERRRNHGTDHEERRELATWRKEWDLLETVAPNYVTEDMYGKDVKLTKDDMDKLLYWVTHNRDYFDTYDTVMPVVEALDEYDEYVNEGWEYVINANW